MDEDKRKIKQEEDHVIDLEAARKERQKEEKAEEKRRAKAERPSLFKRILSFILIVAVVMTSVALTVYWDELNIDAIRRTISYIGVSQDELGQTEPFSYERGNENAFEAFGKSLAHLTNKELTVYDQRGQKIYQKDVQFEHPALEVGRHHAAAYDIGGSSVVVFTERDLEEELKLEKDLGIYGVSLNRSDWMAVISQKKGQKACVSIYNEKNEKVFEYDSASRYIMDAYVTEDCKFMVAETLGQEEGNFQAQMVIYRLDQEKQYAEFALDDTLVLSVGSLANQILCIGDERLAVAAPNGEVTASYEYELPYLREFSDEGDDFVVLFMNRHRAGTDGKLITVAADGTVLAERNISEEILDLSVAGKYIAVLYADRLVIYNKDLTEYESFTEIESAMQLCLRTDGSAWIIMEDQALLLIP